MTTPPNRSYAKFGFDTEFFEVVGASSSGSPASGEAARPNTKSPDEYRQEGYDAGYAAGVAEGRKQAEQALVPLQEHLQALLANLEHTVAVREEQLMVNTLSLVRLTLHHLLSHAAQHYPEEVLEQHLKAVIPLVKADESLMLRISPAAQTYHEKLKLPQASILGLPMQIVTDASLAPTDVSIEWRGGGVESKLAQHWEHINALVLGAGAAPLPVSAFPMAGPSASAATSSGAVPPNSPPEPLDPRRARAAELLGDDELIDALK